MDQKNLCARYFDAEQDWCSLKRRLTGMEGEKWDERRNDMQLQTGILCGRGERSAPDDFIQRRALSVWRCSEDHPLFYRVRRMPWQDPGCDLWDHDEIAERIRMIFVKETGGKDCWSDQNWYSLPPVFCLIRKLHALTNKTLRGTRTRANRKFVAKATALSTRVPQAELFILYLNWRERYYTRLPPGVKCNNWCKMLQNY